ncbi:MAG TPA: response regulator [bacterium]|nr:response regulator [bacterium]
MATKKQILVVEDDRDLQVLLKKKLQADGYSCIPALNVESALKALRQEHPSLVILDLGLPDASGTAFLRSAKEWLAPGEKLPPVIVLSGYDDKEIVDYAIGEGAQCFLAKPLDAELLLTTVNDCLSA